MGYTCECGVMMGGSAAIRRGDAAVIYSTLQCEIKKRTRKATQQQSRGQQRQQRQAAQDPLPFSCASRPQSRFDSS
jgi:hypothetical protein